MDKSYRTFRLLIVHTRTMLKIMANLACSSQLPRLTRPETIATQAMTNLKKKLVVIEVVTIVKLILAFKSEIHALQICAIKMTNFTMLF